MALSKGLENNPLDAFFGVPCEILQPGKTRAWIPPNEDQNGYIQHNTICSGIRYFREAFDEQFRG